MEHHVSMFLIVLLSVSVVQINGESVFNWLWGQKVEAKLISNGVPLLSVPYESLTEDEKFLKEAAKFVSDIQISSPLEVCQHKVILKIKTSCSSMTEEQLAKLSVNLLNCQSESEGRKTYRCTEDMTIKQCTTNMDADTWNAYHLMSNRARAVCYAARSHQFRALTELTVNKLMQSAHSQIETLSSLKESQDRLEEQTHAAHKIIESNIEDLTEEKALIRAGHEQLAAMTEDIQKKLEKASNELLEQAEEHGQNHEEIIADLKSIQNQAQQLWEKIESSTNRIIHQNQEAASQYQETLVKLEKINQTIVYIWDLTNNMRTEIDKKLGWITEYIGTTGENLEKVYRITLHLVYLFAAMVVAAFLQAPFLTRSAILGIVPLNLASYLKHGLSACLDFISMSMLILLITAMHFIMSGIHYLLRPKDDNDKENKEQQSASFINGTTESNGYTKVVSHTHQHAPRQSLGLRIVNNIYDKWGYINYQITHSIVNLKNISDSIVSWIRQKFVSTEELSCTYLPERQRRAYVSERYPSISEDSAEFPDEQDGSYIISDDESNTSTVLRAKFLQRDSPQQNFPKGLRDSAIRNTMHVPRESLKLRSFTPVMTKSVCGATTRSGNPCRNVISKDQFYCHRHTSGSSIIGD
ncbi:protein brambleberry-like [Phymastichus coffea]|uniref:protein brambleberry-like n=1 Tax=Phymastichus coffea TaxID=108790 RepID=UPI00273BFCE8|nr:protein brambleberry-like [Phymastichus coffea]XP_058792607.1 protein brambleberry-like [Phymastichus coffea]